jgi:FkbM family methyltransferase
MARVPYGLKWLAQKTAKRLGYRIDRIRDAVNPIDVFRLVVEREIDRDPDFFIVQIGANDGLVDDPVRPFILRHSLRALLIEPQPGVFERLRKNYEGQPQLVFENVAVAAAPGTVRLYTADGAGSQDYLASFDPSVVRKHLPYGARVAHVDVPAARLDALLGKHGIGHVSLLQIDTEGYDHEVIKMLDFASLKPTIINFEHVHLAPADYTSSVRRLTDAGYRVLAQHINTVAYLQDG